MHLLMTYPNKNRPIITYNSLCLSVLVVENPDDLPLRYSMFEERKNIGTDFSVVLRGLCGENSGFCTTEATEDHRESFSKASWAENHQ